jgi:rhodanese-related sulfurtransferase
MTRLSASDARARLHAGDEIAFLDLREAGQFGESHPLFATPAPYSRLELIVPHLVPRRDAPILLIDAGDGVSECAAQRLAAAGYSDVALIEGGVPAWERAGFPLYKGVNVPSKTLGELAETVWHPQMIRPEQLAHWQREGRDFAFFDTRPPNEYAKMRVPGAKCLPNGELAHRLAALPHDQPIVITCAGRTRGITGWIGLAQVAEGARVHALENGTQGWALAGFDLERGNTAQPLPELDAEGLEQSRRRAEALIERHGLPVIDAAGIAALRGEAGRTTYVMDVRSDEEAANDPLPAAAHAPGVQLVQATDQWIAVRRSRIVLCCDTGLRSAIAAFWLRQLGYEPLVARIDDALRALPAMPLPGPRLPDGPDRISARKALARVREGARLIDLRPSPAYHARHVAGAIWAIRPRLAAIARRVGRREALLVAETPEIAQLAAIDLREAGVGRICIVEGGQPALEREGAAVESAPHEPARSEAIDFLHFVHDRHDGNLEASRRYLAWETGLIDQLDAVERQEFRLITPAG